MLQITYTTQDTEIAKQMQADLSQSNLRLQQHMMLVLISPEAVADQSVLGSINKARKEQWMLAPIILRKADLPDTLHNLTLLDLQNGYDKKKVFQFVNQVDIGKERIGRNRRWLFYVSVVVLLVFAISIASLASGVVAPPNAEFATENALQNAQIDTVIAPELEALRPRTTEDAQNFPATVEAAHKNLQPFIIGTATAIPRDRLATEMVRETVIVETLTAQAETSGD
jgi:hypothetical protein